MWSTETKARLPKRCCNVHGCYASSKWQPESFFYPVPLTSKRREMWLKAINREDVLNKSFTLYICDKHFEESDILLTPKGKELCLDAVPRLFLPPPIHNPFEKGVQVCSELGTAWVQTTRNFKSDMVVQAGPSFTTEERHNRKLTEELEKYQNHLKMIESGELSYQMDLFHKSCDKFLSPQLSELIKTQTKMLINDTDKKNAYLPYLSFCLNLYHASPRAYRYLKDDLQLPSITTLKGMVIPISTKVTDDAMAPLKLKVSNMMDIEKYCSVMVDIMPLKSFLAYNSKEDKIVGFHEIDGDQVLNPARRAVVVVVKGIFVDWTQPIGFSLISDTKCSQDISMWIDKILHKLLDIGLKVKTFVCTSKSKYLDERNIRSVTIDRPFFIMKNVKIYYMFDTPYILRQLRNIFLTHEISYQKDDVPCLARFKDVNEFYELDKTRRLKFAPKLTSAHVAPTQSEKKETIYAAQLFSRSVATGLSSYIDFNVINSDFSYRTVDFVLLINNLFDLLNASTPKSAFCGKTCQIKVLEESLKIFTSLKLINTRTWIERTTMPAFVEGFQINIKAILLLLKEFEMEECKKLMTRRLNLEVTENFIKKIKPKGKIPATQRFMRRFRKLYLSDILQPPKMGTSSENLGTSLGQLNDSCNNLCATDQISQVLIQCVKELPVQMLLEMAETNQENRTYHFCGFLLKKCADYHNNCEILKTYVSAFELKYGLVETADGALKPEPISSGEFIDYVTLMENLSQECFKTIKSCWHIGSVMQNTFKCQLASLAATLPCSCFPVEFLQQLFIRLRINMIIHYNNRFYRKNRFQGTSFVFPSL